MTKANQPSPITLSVHESLFGVLDKAVPLLIVKKLRLLDYLWLVFVSITLAFTGGYGKTVAMLAFSFRLVFGVALILVSAEGRVVLAACPSVAEIDQLLRSEIKSATRVQANLDAILNNKATDAGLPLAQLLDPNLGTPTGVAAFRMKLDQLRPGVELSDRFPDCKNFSKNVQALNAQKNALEQSVIKQKITLLSLPKDQRDILLEAYQTNMLRSEQSEKLDESREQASDNLKEAILQQEAAEKKATQTGDESLIRLANQRARLEQAKIALSEAHLKLTGQLQEEDRQLSKLLDVLHKLSLESDSESLSILVKNFKEVSSLWRDHVDTSLSLRGTVDLPAIPEGDPSLLSRLGDSTEAKAYEESYRKAVAYQTQIESLVQTAKDQQVVRRYKLLLQLGRVRSQYLRALEQHGDESAYQITSDTLDDYLRELRIVPFRFVSLFQSKTADFKTAINRGLGGVMQFFRDTLIFIVFLFIPFGLFWVLAKVPPQLEKFRLTLIKPPHHRNKSRVRAALYLQRLSPYLPWILSYIAVLFGEDIVSGSIWEELGFVLPYFRYYILYRIFLLALQRTLAILVVMGQFGRTGDFRRKATKTGRIIGFFFLIVFSVLHTAETTVGKALIYHFVARWMYFLGLLLFMGSAFAWRKEIASAGSSMSSEKTGAWFTKLCEGRFSLITSLGALILLICLLSYQAAVTELSELETIKKFSAKVLRRRLEATGKHGDLQNIEALPEEYSKWFNYGVPEDKDIWVEPSGHALDRVQKELRHWANGRVEENTLAIYGEKGAGKSSLFAQLSQKPMEGVTFKTVTIPPKIHTRDASNKFFSELLGMDLSEGYSQLANEEEKPEKTIYLLDDAHNLFLADIGAFEGFRAFLDLINVRTANIFWTVAFNIHSWNYLDSVFGKTGFSEP